MTNKELFQKFSNENEASLPFSLHFNWWNEVVIEDWDVAVVSDNNQVKAVMPYFIRKKGPWKFLCNPHFTPYTGPFIIYPEDQKNSSKISYENKIQQELIDQLPDFSDFQQKFHLEYHNSLPFLWNEFVDQKRFTYLLNLDQELSVLVENFRENNRRQLKKADKLLEISEVFDAELLKEMLQSSYSNQADEFPNIPIDYFERVLAYAQKYSCGKMLIAKDKENKVHASTFIIWDAKSAYYLIGGSNSLYKNSGAMSFLMYQSISVAKKLGKNTFNFEGSSIESIEKYLRGFGGNLTPYSLVTKNNSSSLSLLKKIK